MVTKKYTILSYNIGNYETIKEVKYKSPNAEYIYVTDNTGITSSTWNVIYLENQHPEDNFDLCYDIRFNPFKYASTDIVLRIDGSMEVIGNTDELIDKFNEGGYDIALCIHPLRNVMYDEYLTWCKCRGYPIEQANKCLYYMQNMEGYDIKNYKGLYQYNFMIQRKNKVNMDINRMTLAVLKYLADGGKQIERLDQTIGSFIINKYFGKENLKVMPVSNKIGYSRYFQWYFHNTDTSIPFEGAIAKIIEPYLFNEKIEFMDLDL